METPTMNRRRGFSLIEMLVVITIGATLSGIAVLMLHALLRSHNTGREHLEYARTINRLAEQFRADVHAMQQAMPAGDEMVFELSPLPANDTIIRYKCLERRIDRSELQGGQIVSQDSFMLPLDMAASIKTELQQDVSIARIAISPKDNISPKLYRAAPIRIEAVLGRDSRLSKTRSSTEGRP
jgi:prepilin-type N-terminal cleavage/methylation domain-containing protein